MKRSAFAAALFALTGALFYGCGGSSGGGASGSSDTQSSWDWTIEEGVRMPDITSSCTLLLPDNTYRTYTPGIRTATSSDGLTWSSLSPVNGLNAGPGEFFSNPSVIRLADGTFMMIYEKDANNVRSLYRAVSSDGITFTPSSSGAVMYPGSGDNNFLSVPDMVFINGTTIRMYFVAGGDFIDSATSSDNGMTWTREGRITIPGVNTSQQLDPDIVAIEGGYRLFFATPPPGVDFDNMRIWSATSTDGRNFTLEAGERVGVDNASQLRLDPDVVLTPEGFYRMYFGEATSAVANDFSIHSAVSGG